MPSCPTPASAIAKIFAATLAAAFWIHLPAARGAVTFGPTHDARVESANPTTHYGAVTPLRIRGGTVIHSFLKFTVTGLGGPIDGARVRLFCDDASVDGGRIYAVSNDYLGTTTPWTEGGLNWNNAPAIAGPILDQHGEIFANTWVEFDVTPALTGNGTFSFGMTSSSSNIAGFRSKEGVNPPQLVVTFRVPPVIVSFAPASGAVGTEVTLSGTGFLGITSVGFNGVSAPGFVVDSDVQVRAVVPEAAATGRISVTNAWGTASSATDFTIVPPVPQQVFAPAHDARVESASPTGNFGSNPLLRVRGGTPIHSYLKFEVTGLAGTVGSARLLLHCNDESADGGRVHAVSNTYAGTSTSWLESGLTWNNAPVLSGPPLDLAGPVANNTWVEFDVTAAVAGNGTHSFGLTSDLTNIAGYSSKEGTRPPQLVVQLAPPTLIGFAPTAGSVGAEVTVTGTGFSGVTEVEFNGVAAEFTIDSGTQLRAIVPGGATTGPIRVTGPAGTAVGSPDFIVLLAPTIVAFSPLSGLPGTEVSIHGTALGTVTAVEFHGTPATFVIQDETRVQAIVPAGAVSGRIRVENPAGSATSPTSFAVLIPPAAVPGLWTSAAELAGKPMSGLPWTEVLVAADTAANDTATVSDQDNHDNVSTLAAAIAFARTGLTHYRDIVFSACDSLVAWGMPPGRSLAWARETGAYVLAADLAGYRTAAFENWLRNMAEIWEAEEGRYLLEAFFDRPNNWGANAFGTLAAIYAYLGDSVRLTQIRDYWISALAGPNPGHLYDDDLTWHADSTHPRPINPPGATLHGFNVDGLIPDDMQRGGSFKVPPEPTNYPWEHMQGLVMAARVLERRGLPIWREGDDAIYRAAYAMQVRLEQAYGGWKATADDLWMLPFLDAAYGTDWSEAVSDDRLWQAGKNAGWAYVVWDPAPLAVVEPEPAAGVELGPVSPNPIREFGIVTVHLSAPNVVDLQVIDLAGRVVRTLAEGHWGAGVHLVALPTQGLASGMYVVRLSTAGTSRSVKVAIVR